MFYRQRLPNKVKNLIEKFSNYIAFELCLIHEEIYRQWHNCSREFFPLDIPKLKYLLRAFLKPQLLYKNITEYWTA